MESNVGDKLWQIANGVTAFVAVQAIAYLYITAEPTMQFALSKSKCLVMLIIVAAHLGYAYAVFWAQKEYQRLVGEPHGQGSSDALRVSTMVMRGQLLAIAFFGLFAVCITARIDWYQFCTAYMPEAPSCSGLKTGVTSK